MMQLTQVAQHAEDLDRAAEFYTRFFGAEPAARFEPPGLLFFRLDNTRLLLERGAPSATLYLRVPSVRAKVDELRARGVQIDSEAHIIFTHENNDLGPAGHDEWQAFFTDSEGNGVGLVSFEPTRDAQEDHADGSIRK
jgi:methylmalonyl-CoA/ethylmalonyl-CoA epimerase